MDDVFNTPIPKDEGQGDPTAGQQVQQEPQQQPQQQPQDGDPGAAPPAAQDTTKHVPLEALEAERKGRQDWKEKAIRAEEEARQLREQMQRAQAGQQPQQQDPLLVMQQQIVNERFNVSEMVLRSQHQDVDDMVAVFKEAAAKNPALVAQMHANQHPWKFAYEEGKRLKFASEIGNDPEAYRKKLEAEIRSKVEAELSGQTTTNQSAAAPAPPVIPASLAGARSAGARGNTFTGPTPLETLFPN
jgi:hypothetical protein